MKSKPEICWPNMVGSRTALHWNRRDLPVLDRAMKETAGRTAVVQAGANLGIFPKYLSYFFETVYTFEPSPKLFEMTCKNAPERNVVKFNAAVGNDRKLVAMSQTRRSKEHMPAHEGITHVSGEGTIPTLRIDDLRLPVCDMICLDLEGYEPLALLGATETISLCKPVLLIEVNGNAEHYGYNRESVRGLIESFGYRFVKRIMSDELYVYDEGEQWRLR